MDRGGDFFYEGDPKRWATELRIGGCPPPAWGGHSFSLQGHSGGPPRSSRDDRTTLRPWSKPGRDRQRARAHPAVCVRRRRGAPRVRAAAEITGRPDANRRGRSSTRPQLGNAWAGARLVDDWPVGKWHPIVDLIGSQRAEETDTRVRAHAKGSGRCHPWTALMLKCQPDVAPCSVTEPVLYFCCLVCCSPCYRRCACHYQRACNEERGKKNVEEGNRV